MTAGERLGATAAGLVGCRFRLHGRDPATGLDCVGLLAEALAAVGIGADFPVDYTLKCKADQRIDALAQRSGLVPVSDGVMVGDVLLMQVGPCQLHLVIAAEGGGVIHAHAGLRRVVRSPCLPEGNLVAHWRLLNS